MDRLDAITIWCSARFSAGVREHSSPMLVSPDQPYRLLVALLESPGEVISREELRSRLWPDDTFVDFDGSLRVAVGKLREALDDSADDPRYIETIPKRGYRFLVAEVRRVEAAPEVAEPAV